VATWLGTAGFLLDDGQTQLLIDPFVSCPSLLRVALNRPIRPDDAAIERWAAELDMDRVAAVIVTHNHYDHSMDAPGFAARCGAPLYGCGSTAMIGRGAGLPEDKLVVVQPRWVLRAGEFEVHFLPSKHGPSPIGAAPHQGTVDRPLVPPAHHAAWRQGEAWVLWVRHPAGSFVHQGSSDVLPETLEGVRAELCMSCLVWRRSTEELLRATVDAVGATRLVPLHSDDMFRPPHRPYSPMPGADVEGFFRDMERLRPGLRVETLPLGKPRVLFAGQPTHPPSGGP
jgi:L-ascorbate metabolism protein UlaG (beta-lactamase superfamily)